MFQIYTLHATHRERVTTADSFEGALAWLRGVGIVHMEEDADFPGCADAFARNGLVYSVEPVGEAR